MADPLDVSDLAGHTGAGCAHRKMDAIRVALVAWRNGTQATAAFANLKTRLEAACPGVDWTAARILRALRVWIGEA